MKLGLEIYDDSFVFVFDVPFESGAYRSLALQEVYQALVDTLDYDLREDT